MYIHSTSKHRRSGTAMQKLPSRGDLARANRRREVLQGFPVETCFKSETEVLEYLSHAKVTCLLCGQQFSNLGTHLKLIHETDADQYREKYGISHKHGLCGADYLHWRQTQSPFALEPGKYGGKHHAPSRKPYVPPYKLEDRRIRCRANLKKATAESVKKSTKINPSIIEQVCCLVQEGYSLEAACNSTSMTFSGVKKALKRLPEMRAKVDNAIASRTARRWSCGRNGQPSEVHQ